MIKLFRPPETEALDVRTRRFLSHRRQYADSFSPRASLIGAAWKSFLDTKAKDRVADALDRWSHCKCAYCEQVAAKDIEHFYPKADYPKQMFRWDNLLRGCKNCNNAKRDRFPLDDDGRPQLIDPTKEEPLDFLRWDFVTGRAVVNPANPFRSRAEATSEMFDLDQGPLCEERRSKLLNVQYLLAQVVMENPVRIETRERLQDELSPHRPWLAIVRQLFRYPGSLQRLIDAAQTKLPEIGTWIRSWS